MITVTIITTVLNNKNFIINAIDCVKEQSYKSIEHLIIDGGSTDGTYEMLLESQKSNNFNLFQKKSTIYEALNFGVKNSTGEIVGILHSDDIFENELIIEKIVNLFNKKKFDVLYGNLYYVANNNKIIRNWISGPYSDLKIQTGWMPPHPTLFLKKKIFNISGYYDERFLISADFDLINKIFRKKNISFGYINEYIVRMRVGGKSNKSFRNIIIKMKEDYVIINKYSKFPIIILILKNLRKVDQLWK